TRPRKYSKLSATDAIQADCDVKATNIIIQGLRLEVYALVSNHRIAKELWERIQLLMQGTSLTKQERECKLYDDFDSFVFITRWGKGKHYMSKLVRDLTQTNIVQLHAYLWTHEFHANGSFNALTQLRDPLLHGCNPSDDLVSLSSSSKLVPKHSISTMSFTHIINQQLNFPNETRGLIVLVFQNGDHPIDAINHMMSFLIVVVTSRYPTTNNQLRNSSNPRQQASINNGRVTLQPIQGRQTTLVVGTTRTYTPGASGSNSGKQRTAICYNCKREGHMSKQCTKPKRKRDDYWFKDKVLLVQAQASGQILHEEELEFLADPGILEG
ncbi:retrovirus-related pol polyprotein from transposon TNT 1-94, partial [Tanacetum coccineum]